MCSLLIPCMLYQRGTSAPTRPNFNAGTVPTIGTIGTIGTVATDTTDTIDPSQCCTQVNNPASSSC